ncbi:MAG TPA: gliding motility-associated C-terminal domain-containing protein, partial [Agriterribacter sp.]|nr:gliding motility-associated C-terminal domain-containing protein [Agriterribacter sp.]
ATAGMNNARYRCIVTNTCGADSSIAAVLTIADPATPISLSIDAGDNPLCAGNAVVFTATVTPGSSALSYEWTINGLPVGDNSAEFETAAIANGDVLRCRIVGDNHCMMDNTIISDSVILEVVPSVAASVDVVASANEICEGSIIDFTANAVNEGDAPQYQWQINGIDAGANSISYSTSELKDGDIVTCILTSSLVCSSPAISGSNIIVVHPTPVVRFDPGEVLIQERESTILQPIVEGQAVDYRWTPVSGLNNPSIKEPLAGPLETTTYQLEVTSDKGCTTNGSIVVKIYRALQMPSAFTPNKDGINDLFRVPPEFSIKLHSFSIYNRWGQKIFSTIHVEQGWDGQNNSRQQAEGIYTWVIRYDDPLTGNTVTAKGNVMLIQ